MKTNLIMNNIFSLEQGAKASDLKTDLILKQYTLDKMAKIMEIKSINPKLKHSQIAREQKISSSTLQRYRIEVNMPSPYRIPPSNTHTGKHRTSNHSEYDLKMTSKHLKRTSNDLKEVPEEPI